MTTYSANMGADDSYKDALLRLGAFSGWVGLLWVNAYQYHAMASNIIVDPLTAWVMTYSALVIEIVCLGFLFRGNAVGAYKVGLWIVAILLMAINYGTSFLGFTDMGSSTSINQNQQSVEYQQNLAAINAAQKRIDGNTLQMENSCRNCTKVRAGLQSLINADNALIAEKQAANKSINAGGFNKTLEYATGVLGLTIIGIGMIVSGFVTFGMHVASFIFLYPDRAKQEIQDTFSDEIQSAKK